MLYVFVNLKVSVGTFEKDAKWKITYTFEYPSILLGESGKVGEHQESFKYY